MKKGAVISIILVSLITPFTVSAQFGGIKGLISSFGDLVQMLTTIMAALALLVFLWGLVKFIFAVGGDEKAVAQGKTLMIWGLIALFVMASVAGIIAFMQRELGLPGTASGNLPSSNNSGWFNYSTPGGVDQNSPGYLTPTFSPQEPYRGPVRWPTF